MTSTDENIKEGYNYLNKKWALDIPMCDYINNIMVRRDVRDVFVDCLARLKVVKKKHKQLGNKFTSLLENVKAQHLEEKRKNHLAFLAAPTQQTKVSSLFYAGSHETITGIYIYIYIYRTTTDISNECRERIKTS